MSKLLEIDGKHFRVRRGKLVQIPPQWVGEVTHPQTIRKRKSTRSRKLERRVEQKKERKDTFLLDHWD